MIYYQVIAGSRSYGLEIEGSDIDLCRAADEYDIGKMYGPYNLIQVPLDELRRRIIENSYNAYYLQWLFPYKVLSNNTLTDFLQSNRELIISAQKAQVYDILMAHANGLSMYADKFYDLFPKRLAYAALFYSMAVNYANGMSFAQAHHAGELQGTLLALRRKELPLNDVLRLVNEQKIKAQKVQKFYMEPTNDEIIKETNNMFKNVSLLI